jgi:hypothetical protein
MLPAWVGAKKARAAQKPVAMEIADSIATAPGWRVIGEDFYTCVPPVDRQFDPSVLELIHSFDAGIIPIWRKQRYLRPGGKVPETFTHFGIARRVDTPSRNRLVLNVEMPEGEEYRRPNELIAIYEAQDETLMHHGGPGAYLPVDMRLYWTIINQFLWAHVDWNKDAARRVEAVEARKRKRAEDARAEAEEKGREFDKWAQRQLDKPGDSIRGFLEYRARMRARKPRPFVHMGGGA